MEYILIVGEVVIFLGVVGTVLLMKHYLPSYLTEKGKNLATKEDIEAITRKVESVRTEYATQVEILKAALSDETERFKVILSFQSETYKLVAQKRFESILALWASSEALITTTDFSDVNSIRTSLKQIDVALTGLGKYSILFSPQLFTAINSYLKKTATVLTNSEKQFESDKSSKGQISQVVDAALLFSGILSQLSAAVSLASIISSTIVPSVEKYLEKIRLQVALDARNELETALRTELGVHLMPAAWREQIASDEKRKESMKQIETNSTDGLIEEDVT